MPSQPPRITHRPFSGDADFWRVRQLLIDTYLITSTGCNWEIRRWDGHRFHDPPDKAMQGWEATHHLWETSDGQLIGIAHPEGGGDAYFDTHPDYRARIEDEMIAWAEENLAAVRADGARQLDVFTFEHDMPRILLLEQHGFEKTPYWGMLRHMHLGGQPLPDVQIAEGYTLRETRTDPRDYERMAALLNAAFNRTIHNAPEYENFVLHAPCFRHDLNLVAEAGDGTFAAHVGIAYEPTNAQAVFEPVCTHPEHRRKGLAQRLMHEGLHRMKRLGVKHVNVDTGDMTAANALYNSIGFTGAYRGYYWKKVVK